ncbi:MAG: DUF192 domain-containing protein [Planctomycetota bacterium]
MTGSASLAFVFLTIGLVACDPAADGPTREPDAVSTETSTDEATSVETPEPVTAETLRVTLGDQSFDLELALEPATRIQGLSDRAYIAPDGGMLFAFPRAGNLNFVMRRCLVPIDIVFLDPGGRITATHAMQIEPYDRPDRLLRKYGSRYPAQFAIEVAGGTLESLALRPGDRIDLPLEDLKARAR